MADSCPTHDVASDAAALCRLPELLKRPVYWEENPWEDPVTPTYVCLVYSEDPVITWDVGVYVEEYLAWQVGSYTSLAAAIDAALQRAKNDEEAHREQEDEEGE